VVSTASPSMIAVKIKGRRFQLYHDAFLMDDRTRCLIFGRKLPGPIKISPCYLIPDRKFSALNVGDIRTRKHLQVE
jgi:hypothetical protein